MPPPAHNRLESGQPQARSITEGACFLLTWCPESVCTCELLPGCLGCWPRPHLPPGRSFSSLITQPSPPLHLGSPPHQGVWLLCADDAFLCHYGHMAWGCPGGQGSINPAALQGRLTTHSASGSSYVRDSCKQGRGSQAVPSPLGAPAPKPQPFSAPAPCAL